MSKTITLRRMGCPFLKNDIMNHISDVGNHRVRAEFTDKGGRRVIVDFMHNPDSSVMFTDGQYTKGDSPSPVWREHPKVGYGAQWDKDYTLSGILNVINSVSAEHYDEIKLEG